MSKNKSPNDRSAKIEGDATGNVIITGDGNVVSLGGPKTAGRQDRGDRRVFISSTSEDLKEYRKAARDAAMAAGILPIQMGVTGVPRCDKALLYRMLR